MIANTPERVRQLLQKRIKQVGECWIWQGAKSKSGYGQISIDQVQQGTHRLAFQIHVGPIPEGLLIRHSCDNRACINPAHLLLGTHKDNAADRERRNRSKVGEAHNKAKLTATQAKAVLNDTRSQVAIAKDYGVWQTTISDIKLRKSWKSVCI